MLKEDSTKSFIDEGWKIGELVAFAGLEVELVAVEVPKSGAFITVEVAAGAELVVVVSFSTPCIAIGRMY